MTESSPTIPHGESPPLPPPRFRWPMRLFLGFLIFDMVFHSLAALTPYREWLEDDFRIARLPKRLPTLEEITELQAKASPSNPGPVSDRLLESFDSVWEFLKPWPDQDTRRKLKTWEDKGKFALTWVTSRLDFFESLAGTPQRWTMFSPNASRGATVARIRLLFQDGSRQDVRLTADPVDLTNYSHWFQEKVLDSELRIPSDWDSRFGYCNYLKHQFNQNAKGSPLEKIYIYKIKYRYPDPSEDAVEVLRSQNGPPNWDQDGPDFVYDVASNRMRTQKDKHERKKLQQRLNQSKTIVP